MPLHIEVARWAIVALYSLVLVIASLSDINTRRIPNWTILATIVLYSGWAIVGPSVSVISSLEAAGIVFVITSALYAFHFMGAGDSKLMTAVALFAGLGQLPLFTLATVLFGGAIAVLSLATRPTRTLVMFQTRGKGDFGRGIPYGVAISLAGTMIVLSELACTSFVFSRSICIG